MDGQEIKDLVESILDDSVDSTLFLTLLNAAKDRIEDNGINWEILKAWDSSKTASPSDTYTTLKSLAADFRRPLGNIYIGDKPYFPINMEKRETYKNSSDRFYIDYAQSKFAVIGSPATSQTIYMPYLKTSEDLTLETTWGFPSRFHPILGFIIAGYITAGVDADDIYARMSPEHKMAAKVIEGNMRRWNNSLVLHSMNNSAAEEPEDVGVSLSMM